MGSSRSNTEKEQRESQGAGEGESQDASCLLGFKRSQSALGQFWSFLHGLFQEIKLIGYLLYLDVLRGDLDNWWGVQFVIVISDKNIGTKQRHKTNANTNGIYFRQNQQDAEKEKLSHFE